MTLHQLIADIFATFPGIKAVERESCTGRRHWMIGAEQHVSLPDGLGVFCDCDGCRESGTHEDGVHAGFVTWLENRGYYLEREDEFWFVPTAIPSAEEIAAWHSAVAIASAKRGDVVNDGCPF